jgi:RNA polymerase sigma-70 factor (ECF subfamily)
MSIAALPSARGVTLTSEIEVLFRDHHELIYRTAYSVTGSKPDAEDVLQTIFLRLLPRGLPPDHVQNPAGYLYRAAVNVSLDIVRNRRRRNPEGRERTLVSVHPALQRPDTEREWRVREALAQLNPRAVEIVVLRYVHDYRDAEIAKMLGTSRGAIAVTLFRARVRLRTLLSPDKSGGAR